MRPIGRLLPDALGRNEVLRTARAQAVLRRWEEIVGPEMARRSWPDRYTQGTVWVAVNGSAWASELRFKSESILSKLRSMAEEPDLFVKIRFGQRDLPEPDIELPIDEPEPNLVDPDLSIREIVERRLKMRRDAEGT
ncbi:hypothetical protein BH11ARM1_BH11ARM1_01370 [soil metagenome]